MPCATSTKLRPTTSKAGVEGVLHPQLHSFQDRAAPPNHQGGHPNTGAALLGCCADPDFPT